MSKSIAAIIYFSCIVQGREIGPLCFGTLSLAYKYQTIGIDCPEGHIIKVSDVFWGGKKGWNKDKFFERMSKVVKNKFYRSVKPHGIDILSGRANDLRKN